MGGSGDEERRDLWKGPVVVVAAAEKEEEGRGRRCGRDGEEGPQGGEKGWHLFSPFYPLWGFSLRFMPPMARVRTKMVGPWYDASVLIAPVKVLVESNF